MGKVKGHPEWAGEFLISMEGMLADRRFTVHSIEVVIGGLERVSRGLKRC